MLSLMPWCLWIYKPEHCKYQSAHRKQIRPSIIMTAMHLFLATQKDQGIRTYPKNNVQNTHGLYYQDYTFFSPHLHSVILLLITKGERKKKSFQQCGPFDYTKFICIPLGRSESSRTPVSTVQHRATFSFVYPPPPVTCRQEICSQYARSITLRIL